MLICRRYVTIKINCILLYGTPNFLRRRKNGALAAKINWAGNHTRKPLKMTITDRRL